VALTAAVVGAVAGYLLGVVGPTEYTADSRVILSEPGAFDPLQQRSNDDPTRFLQTQAYAMLTLPVLQSAATALGGGTTPETLANATDVSTPNGSDVLVVAARASSPAAAAARANAIVTAYRQDVAQRVAGEGAAAAAATNDPTLQDTIRTATAVYGDGVALVESATPAGATSSPPLRLALGGAILTMLVAIGLHAWHRSRQADLTEFSDVAKAPLLGVVWTKEQEEPAGEGGSTPAARAVVALEYAGDGRPGPFLFSGVTAVDPTGPVMRNLAGAAAALGRRVAVIDAHLDSALERPGAGRPTGHESDAAGAGAAHPEAGQPAAQHPPGSVVHLRCRPADLRDDTGAYDPVRLSQTFDLVFIDAGPLVYSTTALAIAKRAAAVIAIVDIDADPRVLRPLRERLDAASCALTGLVVTHARRRRTVRRRVTALGSPHRDASTWRELGRPASARHSAAN
jgi:capsular polysaccharide biosynthesis protein